MEMMPMKPTYKQEEKKINEPVSEWLQWNEPDSVSFHSPYLQQPQKQDSSRKTEVLSALQVVINQLCSVATAIRGEPADSLPKENITIVGEDYDVVIFTNNNIFYTPAPKKAPKTYYIVAGPPGVACNCCGGSGTQPTPDPSDDQKQPTSLV